jgi:hypothetical protein
MNNLNPSITTRAAGLLSEAADLITTASDQVPSDRALGGLARLTCEYLAKARQHLATADCSAVPQLLIDAITTIEAFRRLVGVVGPQPSALAALAGTYVLDATLALTEAEVPA